MPERFVKAIRRRDVRLGDVVLGRRNRTHTVDRIFIFQGRPSVLNLHCTDEAMLSGDPDDVVGLVNRLIAKDSERNAQDVLSLARATDAIAAMGPEVRDSHFQHLREAIEIYELGKK